MRVLLAAAFVLAAGPAFAASAIPGNDIISGAIDGYIRPSFEKFAGETMSLKADVAALCATPSADTLSAAQDEFRAAVVAFSRVEFLRLGPLSISDRLERLLFWPDKKGIALKQVQTALAEKDATAATAATLQKKSVAMQGLGALEYLLFGNGSEALGTGDSFRYGYAGAITTLVAGIAATVNAEWQDAGPDGPAAHMLDPKSDAQDYRNSTEVLEKLAGTLINGTETIRDQRLMPIIGAATGVPKPKSALFWRSGMSIPSVAANFAGLKDFFVAAKYAEALGVNNAWVASGVTYEFDLAAVAAAKVVDPLETAVAVPSELRALKDMVTITGTLDDLMGTNLATALGLSIGFSQLDGD